MFAFYKLILDKLFLLLKKKRRMIHHDQSPSLKCGHASSACCSIGQTRMESAESHMLVIAGAWWWVGCYCAVQFCLQNLSLLLVLLQPPAGIFCVVLNKSMMVQYHLLPAGDLVILVFSTTIMMMKKPRRTTPSSRNEVNHL